MTDDSAPRTFTEAEGLIRDELSDILMCKQRDYGPGNIADFGEFGVLVRVNDKVARLKNLLSQGQRPENESIDDTWKDIANYAVIALMVKRGYWGLPMEQL